MSVGHPSVQPLGCECAEGARRLKRDLFHAVGVFAFVLFATCWLELILQSIHTVRLYFHNLLNSASAAVILLLSARCHTLLVHQSPLSSHSSLPRTMRSAHHVPYASSLEHMYRPPHTSPGIAAVARSYSSTPGKLFCFALEIIQLPLKGS